MIAEVGEWKGSKVISLKKDVDDKYPFSFGYGKAKAILECIDSIKDFVAQCESEKIDKVQKPA